MKNLIIILAFLPLTAICQNCKYDKDEYDKFQKTRKLETTVKVVKKFYRGNGYLDIRLCKYGELVFFRAYTASISPIVVGKSDRLIFLLDNDETVEAAPNDIYSSDSNGYRSIFSGTYDFLNSDYLKLTARKIKSVRMYYNSEYQDFEIKNGLADDFLKAAKCIW